MKCVWRFLWVFVVANPCLPFASAQPLVDCPLRDAPYSIDTPLLDLLMKPEAKAVMEREAPGLMQSIPPSFATPPTIAASMSLRMSGAMKQLSDDALVRMDAVLRSLSLTDADRRTRCARYDVDEPMLHSPPGSPRLLVFEKVNGYLHGEAIPAAGAAFRKMAAQRGWSIVFTDKGGAITPRCSSSSTSSSSTTSAATFSR